MQPGLIKRIIAECGLETESKHHGMPAVTKILHKDKEGKYRTIIGMLTYLSMSSWPNIAFAVHQCACKAHVPE